MADGRIVIDARINKKQAVSDLNNLKKDITNTGKEIEKIDTAISKAGAAKNDLANKLQAAKEQAAGTAQELENVNVQLISNSQKAADLKKQMDALSKGHTYTKNGVTVNVPADARDNAKHKEFEQQRNAILAENAKLEKQSDSLANKANTEDAAVTDLTSKYEEQTASVERLNAQKAALEQTRAVQQEQAKSLTAKADDATAKESMAEKVNRAVDAMASFAKKVGLAKNAVSALQGAVNTLGGFGQRIFSDISSRITEIPKRLTSASKSLQRFQRRMLSVASGALVFNVISKALREVSTWTQAVLTQNTELRASLANLESAAITAAAPLLQALVPALTAIANAAATVIFYIAKLISMLTGGTIAANQKAAKAMSKTAKAAKAAGGAASDAAGSLAKFDDLDVLDKSSGGSGGITPNYDFATDSPFLDDVLKAIEDGDWYGAGALLGEKLRDALNSIPWDSIQAKTQEVATHLANLINGFIEVPGLWSAIGHTIAQGLNTALIFADTLMQGVHWGSLGAGIAEGLTTAVAEIQWDTLGRVLTDGLRAAVLTLEGFVTTYTGWTDLGNSIATTIMAAINNVPWGMFGASLSGFALGLLTVLTATVENIDWASIGQDVVDFFSSIDWGGLFGAASTLATSLLDGINTMLEQIDWSAVTDTAIQCLASIDWVGIGTELGRLFTEIGWPLFLAFLTAQIPNLLGTLFTTIIAPAIAEKLKDLLFVVEYWFTTSLLPKIMGLGGQLISYITGTLVPCISNAISGLVSFLIGNPIALVIAAIVALVALIAVKGDEIQRLLQNVDDFLQNVFATDWSESFGFLGTIMNGFGQIFSDIWNGVKTILDGIIDFIRGVFTGDWKRAWNGIVEMFGGIWETIVALAKAPINSVIALVNGMIAAITAGLNCLIDGINSFGFDVPEFAQDALGTTHVGFNFERITAPQIPYLAQGAVIPANHEFLAVLGDQTNGTNIEAPLATIQQALAEVMEAYTGQQDITIRFAGDLAQLARVLKPYIDKEENRRGAKLVTGGVY